MTETYRMYLDLVSSPLIFRHQLLSAVLISFVILSRYYTSYLFGQMVKFGPSVRSSVLQCSVVRYQSNWPTFCRVINSWINVTDSSHFGFGLLFLLDFIRSFVDPKSNFSLFPRWSHNLSWREFPQTHPWFKKFITYKGVIFQTLLIKIGLKASVCNRVARS